MAGKNTNAPNMPSDWEINEGNLTNTFVGLIQMGNPTVESSSCSSAPVVDNSFFPPIWNQPLITQNLGYCDVNIQNHPILKGNMFLPPVFSIPPHFSSDSGFSERAARFSCFGTGNLVEVMNSLNIPNNLNPYSRSLGLIHGQNEVFSGNGLKSMDEMQLQRNEMNVSEVPKEAFKNDKNSENLPGDESDKAEFSERCVLEESSSKGIGSKKRKRAAQGNEHNGSNDVPQASIETVKENAEIKQKGGQKATSLSKNGGKNVNQGSHGSNPPKEEYIHIRARRGQATNSHSLAERVRREKISERMKFLQDLVPGCSKVTGKAVMLDEIINYVQSLQRQVEFLSMKLATVNPHLDLNIEGLLAKDIFQHRAGLSSSSLVFPSDMTMPFPTLYASQPGLVRACLANNSPEILQRPINLHSIAISGGFKEPTSQVPSVWDGELHNIVHMGFNSSAPLTNQDLCGSLPSGNMKAES